MNICRMLFKSSIYTVYNENGIQWNMYNYNMSRLFDRRELNCYTSASSLRRIEISTYLICFCRGSLIAIHAISFSVLTATLHSLVI